MNKHWYISVWEIHVLVEPLQKLWPNCYPVVNFLIELLGYFMKSCVIQNFHMIDAVKWQGHRGCTFVHFWLHYNYVWAVTLWSSKAWCMVICWWWLSIGLGWGVGRKCLGGTVDDNLCFLMVGPVVRVGLKLRTMEDKCE